MDGRIVMAFCFSCDSSSNAVVRGQIGDIISEKLNNIADSLPSIEYACILTIEGAVISSSSARSEIPAIDILSCMPSLKLAANKMLKICALSPGSSLIHLSGETHSYSIYSIKEDIILVVFHQFDSKNSFVPDYIPVDSVLCPLIDELKVYFVGS